MFLTVLLDAYKLSLLLLLLLLLYYYLFIYLFIFIYLQGSPDSDFQQGPHLQTINI